MTKIYTKTGDKGETSLGSGKRVFKDDARIEALGAVDELNAALGIAISRTRHTKIGTPLKGVEDNGLNKVETMLIAVQRDLFILGTILSKSNAGERAEIGSRVKWLEQAIDELDRELTPLCRFILPSGGACGAEIHNARAICRRVERRVASLLHAAVARCEREVAALQYLNRLSDFLFVLARWVNQRDGILETIWTL